MVKNLYTNFFSILNLTDKKLKRKLFIILIFVFLCVLSEFLAISVLPLIILFLSKGFENLKEELNFHNFNFFQKYNEQEILIILVSLLIIIFAIRFVFNLFYAFFLSLFLKDLKLSITKKMIQSVFSLKYLDFKKRDIASTIRLIIDEKNVVVQNYFNSCFVLVLEIFTAVPYILVSTYIDHKIFIILLFFGLLNYLLIKVFLLPKIKYWGAQRIYFDQQQHKKIQDILLSSKNIYLDKLLEKLSPDFLGLTKKGAKFEMLQFFYIMMPRFYLEFIFILFLFSFFFYILFFSEITDYYHVFGTYIVMGFKLLPSLNRIINSNQGIKYSESSINSILSALKAKSYNESDRKSVV